MILSVIYINIFFSNSVSDKKKHSLVLVQQQLHDGFTEHSSNIWIRVHKLDGRLEHVAHD